MKSILDNNFRYTPSASTDIRATFRRLEREKAKAEREFAAAWDEAHAENQMRDVLPKNVEVMAKAKRK